MNHLELHTKAKAIAKRYRSCEAELLEVIIFFDQKKSFRHLGYSSLFSYVTEELKLSPAVASNFITVARKSHEVPELKEQVVAGKISIHQARKITPVVTKENQKIWLNLAQTRSLRKLEREVSLAKPETAIHESLKYVAAQNEVKEKIIIKTNVPRVQLQIGLSEKAMIQLQRARDLESQKRKQNVSLEETLNELLNCYLRKNDPVEKAKRQKARGQFVVASDTRESGDDAKAFNTMSRDTRLDKTSMRKSIPAKVRHQVQLRDGGRCCHRDHKGKRCVSRRYLEIHHRREVAMGGDNTLENLTTLCAGHHKVHHLSRQRE